MADGGEIAKAWVTLIPSFGGGQKKIADELGGVGDGAGKKAGKGFMGGFAAVATAAAGAVAVGAFVKGAIGAAGDLEQSTGAIDAVFKKSAGQMHEWAKTASNDVGLTQNEFNELGTLIGSQLKNGGTAMDQLAPKTNQLIGLGADLSSMFGGTTAEAIEAVSSALKGERDPIEKYGASLNQAAIDAKAAELGFKKVGGALSAEANQAATVALIMDQTADAQGNFAKESSTFQGQLQRMGSAWDDISAKIGTFFLPILTDAMTMINTNVLPAISSFVDGLGSGGLGSAFENIASIAGPFLATLGQAFAPLIPQVMELVTNLSPMSLLFQSLAPVLPLIGTLLQTIAQALSMVLQAVLPIVQQVAGFLIPLFTQLFSAVLPPLIEVVTQVVAAIGPLIQALGPILQSVLTALMPLITTVFGIIQTVITTVLGVVSGIITAFTAALSGDWSGFWTAISDTVSTIWNGIGEFASQFFGELPGKILGALGDLGGLLLDAGGQIMQGLWDGLVAGFEGVKNFVGGIGSWIADNKGPKQYDLHLLVPAGGWIMDGLNKGIGNEMPALGSTLSDVSWMIQNGIDPNMTASIQARTASSVTATTASKSAKDLASVGRGEGVTLKQEIHANDTEEILQESQGRTEQWAREIGLI